MKKHILFLFVLFFAIPHVQAEGKKDDLYYKILVQLEKLRKSDFPFDVLIQKYESLLQITQDRGYDSLTAVIYNDQGYVFYQMASFSNALDCFVRALDFYEARADTAGMGSLYNNLGVISFQAKNYKQALEFFSRSFEIYSKLRDTVSLVNILNNVGSVFERLKEYKKALTFHRIAYRIAQKKQLPKLLYSSLNNIGVVYENTARYDSALWYYQQALTYKSFIPSYEYALTLNNVGRVFFFLNNISEAKPYLDSAYFYSMLGGAKDNLLESYRLYSMYYEKKKDYQQAYTYLKLFKELVLALDSQKVEGKLESYLFQRNKKIFEKEKHLLEKQITLQRKIQWYAAAIIFLFIVILFFVLISVRQRNRILEEKNRIAELERKNIEQELRSQEQLAKLEKEKMQLELEHKERQLATLAMQMTSKSDILKEIERQILDLYHIVPKNKQELLNKLVSYIHLNADDKEAWKSYVYHFEKVYPAFFSRLEELFPQLNSADKRFCSYIFINLSNKEIAHILGISESSVKIRKNRLAKKLNLSSAQNLSEFLREQLKDVIPEK